MVRARKPQPTLDALFFSTPEQKVMKFLLSESTTTFTSRVISSKLKGVRGLGGAEGIAKIMAELNQLGLVEFVDNNRAVRLQDDAPVVTILKIFASMCELEGLKNMLAPISTKGVLFGSRAEGKSRSDSDYNLLIVTDTPEEVEKIATGYPLGKQLSLVVKTPEAFSDMNREQPAMAQKIERGIVLWGSSW